MSLESSLFSAVANNNRADNLITSIERMVTQLQRLVNVQPMPFIFLKSNNDNLSSNVANATIILAGTKVPAGARAVVRDFNLNYTTTAGTVRMVILDASGSIRIDVLRGINASTNGIGETVLEEGEALAVVGQTAGAGVFSVYCSGEVVRIR